MTCNQRGLAHPDRGYARTDLITPRARDGSGSRSMICRRGDTPALRNDYSEICGSGPNGWRPRAGDLPATQPGPRFMPTGGAKTLDYTHVQVLAEMPACRLSVPRLPVQVAEPRVG